MLIKVHNFVKETKKGLTFLFKRIKSSEILSERYPDDYFLVFAPSFAYASKTNCFGIWKDFLKA